MHSVALNNYLLQILKAYAYLSLVTYSDIAEA